MIRLKDLLGEAKQRGVLYHFTSKRRMISILEDNVLKVSTWDDEDFVSLTRNYRLGRKFGDIRIALDGDDLTNRYKIEPYLDADYDAFEKEYDYYDKERRKEREERIKRDITNIKKYIIQVDYMIDMEVDKYEDSTEKLKKLIPNGVSFNFVNKWRPVKK